MATVFKTELDAKPKVLAGWLVSETGGIPLLIQNHEIIDGLDDENLVEFKELSPRPIQIHKGEEGEVWVQLFNGKKYRPADHWVFTLDRLLVRHYEIDGVIHSSPVPLGEVIRIELWPKTYGTWTVGKCKKPEHVEYTELIGNEMKKAFGSKSRPRKRNSVRKMHTATEMKLEKLIEYREQWFLDHENIPTMKASLEAVGIDRKTVIKQAPDLHKNWYSIKYFPRGKIGN